MCLSTNSPWSAASGAHVRVSIAVPLSLCTTEDIPGKAEPSEALPLACVEKEAGAGGQRGQAGRAVLRGSAGKGDLRGAAGKAMDFMCCAGRRHVQAFSLGFAVGGAFSYTAKPRMRLSFFLESFVSLGGLCAAGRDTQDLHLGLCFCSLILPAKCR